MAKKDSSELEIRFDRRKLNIIRFYLSQRGENIDVEKNISETVNKELDRLYRRYVPKDVRFLLDHEEEINNPRLIKNESVSIDTLSANTEE